MSEPEPVVDDTATEAETEATDPEAAEDAAAESED